MKTYTLKLKGTKKHGTKDLTVTIIAKNKSQAFNFAYLFFEKGEYSSTTEWFSRFGLCRVIDFIPDAVNLDKYRGKYKVYHSSF